MDPRFFRQYSDLVLEAEEGKSKKPDFLDMDKDGDKEEAMSKALKDREGKDVEESRVDTTQLTTTPALTAESRGEQLSTSMRRFWNIANQ